MRLIDIDETFPQKFCEAIEIFLSNPDDLIKIDWSKVPSNCYFVSSFLINKGNIYKIENEELKRNLYEFIKNYPDKVSRGNYYV